MRPGFALALLAVIGAVVLSAAGSTASLMQWSDLTSRPRPTGAERLHYGSAPSQVIDVWRPSGGGPFPVVVMIHGGCWTKSVAGLDLMDWAAADLRKRGVAVWNIEYRRLGEAGGGYPGTYQDVAAAIELLRTEAPKRGLKLDRLVVVGHSAGGHLALWAAGRRKLPKSSPLYSPDPLTPTAVIDLAGIANLETDTDTGCGADTVAAMAGPVRPGRFDDTSPAALLPLGVPTYVIHGADDTTVAPSVGRAYVALAQAAGDKVEMREPQGGHAEEIAPGSASWDATADLIVSLVR